MASMMESKDQGLQKGLSEIWRNLDELQGQSRWKLWGQYVRQAWRSVCTAPSTALLTVFTVSLGVLLLASFVWVFQNIRTGLTVSQSSVELSLFLKDEIDSSSVNELKQELEKRPEVATVFLRDKMAALEVMRREFGSQAALLDGLDYENNPLPASLEVTLKPQGEGDNGFEELVKGYREHPLVDFLYYDQGVLNQLNQMFLLVKQIGFLGMTALFVVIGVIIANTIRLAIHTHRQEIEIMSLVGAERGFVRIPFLIEGAVHGCIGALLGVALLFPVVVLLQRAVQQTTLLETVLPEMNFLGFWSWIVLVIASGIVGLLSSFLGIRRLGR